MIIFEKIRWKNFLSTGNTFIEMDLVGSSATLVVGHNGSGKSTMLDALTFVLFNKPFRKILKGQLVNSVNEKDCVVEVEFTIGSINYHVVRGIKPNVFKIFRNGQLIDQDAANKDYQKYLEQSILGLNYKSFTQVVILGSSTFVPFMQLGAVVRREIIEDLLDIKVFSQMNAILKDRIKDTREVQKACVHELALAQQKVQLKEENIENLEQQSDKYLKEKRDRIDRNLQRSDAIDGEVHTITEVIGKLEPKTTKLDDYKDKYDSLKESRTKLNQTLKKTQKDIVFFESNDVCPTCTQEIQPKWKQHHCKTLNESVVDFNQRISDITKDAKEVLTEIKKSEKVAVELIEKRQTVNSLLKEQSRLRLDNKGLEEELSGGSTDLKREKEVLSDLIGEKDDKQAICSNINKRAENLKVVGNLLKDGGIKTKIIRKFIPTINQKINKYLSEMDFFVNFTLDEEFNEVIKSRYRDVFTYSSFSEGEKQKIDLALLFTWRSIAQQKNSANTNLLILDEVFDSSLDNAATEELLKILKCFRDNSNMFVISHKGEVLLDKFPKTIRFSKPNDFSRISDENGA